MSHSDDTLSPWSSLTSGSFSLSACLPRWSLRLGGKERDVEALFVAEHSRDAYSLRFDCKCPH